MRRILFLVYMFTMAGCIQQLQNNIQESNELMRENKVVIEENTQAILQSTATMKKVEFLFPFVLGIIILIVVYIVFRLGHKIFRHYRNH